MPGEFTDTSGASPSLKLDVEGNTGEVTFEAAGGELRSGGGRVAVGAAEARAARERPWELTEALRAGGLRVSSSAGGGGAGVDVLGDTREALWNDLGGMPLAVVLDTTTYEHARNALSGDTRAYALLDLNLLAVAAVFFDYVIIQPDRMLPSKEEAEFTRIVQPAGTEWGHLHALYDLAIADCERNRDDLQAAWRAFLRDPQLTLDLRNPPSANDDERFGYTLQDLPSDRAAVDDYVLCQTVRAVYNDRVAGKLQLPYLASSIRLPVARELIRSHYELLVMLREVMVRDAAGAAAEPGPFTPAKPMYAPLILGVLLDRAAEHGGRDSLMACLAELRADMADFREFLRHHHERPDWHERPQKLVGELRDRLRADLSQSAGARAQTAMLTTVEGASGLAFGPVASLAVKVLQALLPADAAARAARRIFRRELFVLSNVAQEAAGIATLDAQIEKVWGVQVDNQTRKTLDRIAHLNADPLLRVGGV